MTYADIIQDNCINHSPVRWWPKFAYHYTDVTNAVSILASGMLFSRSYVEHMGLMQNDNASRQVIDMTQTEARSCVRFYFRPLTPTQYYNEGFKHIQLRYDDDENANTPVPIFFLFDLAKLLAIPGVQFSEQKQAGYGSALLEGEEAFSKMNFDYIYSNGFKNIGEMKAYRHAEILHKNSLAIDTCLRYIVCRNNVERVTLLNLLKYQNLKAFHKYKDRIYIVKENAFEYNGLYVTNCQYHDGVMSISFSDTYEKKYYTRTQKAKNSVHELRPIRIRVELDWLNSRGIIGHSANEVLRNYESTADLVYKKLPQYSSARTLRIQVYLENKLMCFVEHALDHAELIK